MQKIVTFTTYENLDVQALTQEEFTSNADFDEWVWHLAPSKEAAIEAHRKAHNTWQELGFDFYDHANPPLIRWNHTFDLNFEVTTDREDGEDITADQVRELLREALRLPGEELLSRINIFYTMRSVDAG